MNHGIPATTVSRITEVFNRHPAVEKAILYGSRAKGTHKPGSDIDLALIGGALDWRTVGKIDDTLDDLLLPYQFSLIIFDPKTDPAVAAQIRRVGLAFYEKNATGPKLDRLSPA